MVYNKQIYLTLNGAGYLQRNIYSNNKKCMFMNLNREPLGYDYYAYRNYDIISTTI